MDTLGPSCMRSLLGPPNPLTPNTMIESISVSSRRWLAYEIAPFVVYLESGYYVGCDLFDLMSSLYLYFTEVVHQI
jgi:hypothetical protein